MKYFLKYQKSLNKDELKTFITKSQKISKFSKVKGIQCYTVLISLCVPKITKKKKLVKFISSRAILFGEMYEFSLMKQDINKLWSVRKIFRNYYLLNSLFYQKIGLMKESIENLIECSKLFPNDESIKKRLKIASKQKNKRNFSLYEKIKNKQLLEYYQIPRFIMSILEIDESKNEKIKFDFLKIPKEIFMHVIFPFFDVLDFLKLSHINFFFRNFVVNYFNKTFSEFKNFQNFISKRLYVQKRNITKTLSLAWYIEKIFSNLMKIYDESNCNIIELDNKYSFFRSPVSKKEQKDTLFQKLHFSLREFYLITSGFEWNSKNEFLFSPSLKICSGMFIDDNDDCQFDEKMIVCEFSKLKNYRKTHLSLNKRIVKFIKNPKETVFLNKGKDLNYDVNRGGTFNLFFIDNVNGLIYKECWYPENYEYYNDHLPLSIIIRNCSYIYKNLNVYLEEECIKKFSSNLATILRVSVKRIHNDLVCLLKKK